MNRPMLIILGIGILSGIATGFLSYASDPFVAGMEIKLLFLVALSIVIVSLATFIFYAIAIMWHEGGGYFLARFFGNEADYFKSAFRRAFLVGILFIALFSLNHYGFFIQNFVGGAILITLITEVLFSVHNKKVS